MPRRKDKGYAETFAEGGLIPTSSEEKAKRLAALEGEIERQIKLIEGILDVQVQIVMPDESALRTTKEQEPATTASVTIKYLPGAGGARPVSEPEVQAIVAAGVEKLLPENVVVLMRPVGGPAVAADSKPVDPKKGLEKLGHKRLLIGLTALLVMIALLGLGLVFSQMRLRTVRGRLVRLQNEIAKARRKPGEALPAAGQQAAG
jgi:type III secretion protein J